VVLSHGNVVGNLAPIEAEIAKYLKYERFVHPLRFLNLLPLSHVFGQFLGIFIPPLLGATVVFENTLNPSEIIASIHRERVSVLVAVPRTEESRFRAMCEARGLPATRIGVVDQGSDAIEVQGLFTVSLDDLRATYEGVLPGLFG